MRLFALGTLVFLKLFGLWKRKAEKESVEQARNSRSH